MAVHLPLSQEAQAECRFLLLSPNNLLKPSDGGPVAVPSQDMVLGIYYLTQERPGNPGEGKFFKSVNEAILAYENKVITLQSKIKVRCTRTLADGREMTGIVESTLGRFLFNEILPQDLGFVDRSIPGNDYWVRFNCPEFTSLCPLAWRMTPEDWEHWNSLLDPAAYDAVSQVEQ